MTCIRWKSLKCSDNMITGNNWPAETIKAPSKQQYCLNNLFINLALININNIRISLNFLFWTLILLLYNHDNVTWRTSWASDEYGDLILPVTQLDINQKHINYNLTILQFNIKQYHSRTRNHLRVQMSGNFVISQSINCQ